MKPFDLLGPLPEPNSTTVLEASAGTGKTFALAALVTRYLAEQDATLDEMLLITFSRAATRELRERVRAQLVEAVEAFDTPPAPGSSNALITHLLDAAPEERAIRARRLRYALANFDSATIATTHQFCQIVLKSLGVAGDGDPDVQLVESLDDLVREIVDDVYLAHFGQQKVTPPMSREEALELARDVVENPGAQIRPVEASAGTDAAARLDFVRRVLTELEPRKRRLRIQGYDDLLSRLADALRDDDAPARARMRRRWRIVLVDEFQDTDPIQWQVIERAFVGAATLVLIGDPKQAIYAFRGGDIVTYLAAAHAAGDRRTLATNWRSDRPLVDAVQAVLRGAELGDADIVVGEVAAHHGKHRLAGAPHNAPFRLRVVGRDRFGRRDDQIITIGDLRQHIARDLAADIAELLSSGATFDGEPITAGDVAVIVENRWDAAPCRRALAEVGISSVYSGDADVFSSEAAADWLCLIEAMEQTHRPTLVRAAALTSFFGHTGGSLAEGGDALTDQIAETLRDWSDRVRRFGVAAVFESANLAGMGQRVLAAADGARRMTDLAHLADLLQEAAHRDGLSLPALAALLRGHRNSNGMERTRRLDSEASAVQVMTYWGSKGLEYPVVYLPFMFKRNAKSGERVLFHDDAGMRCLHIGGSASPDFADAAARGAAEAAGEALRLTYVAITRAQSQVVAWWAPAYDEPNGGLSRLLRGRRPGESAVPDRCVGTISDDDARRCFLDWQAVGGPTVEDSVITRVSKVPPSPPPQGLAIRTFDRAVDTTWRRTSYSALVRAAQDVSVGVGSEPETVGKDDETDEAALEGTEVAMSAEGPSSPMADLPGGATFGSLVHAVLETADPAAADLEAELTTQLERHYAWWPVDAPIAGIAAALIPVHDTPLGPLADGLTLRDIGLPDRLRELDFEMPLTGGDLESQGGPVTLAHVADLLDDLLPADDPLAGYSGQLRAPALGTAPLRGYLSGSIDVVLRIPDPVVGSRFVVVDYKTNRLGDNDRPVAADYGPGQLAAAMLHSDYVLQALLYSVVLHRYLRWRLPGYQPEQHLGGVMYLFLRGMCGAATPVIDGHPAGVFSWRPPARLVSALSDLLDGVVP
ncbi:UvrD-helicase domain-containing protein [Mycobacterium sp. ACS4331]|uniref:UvrD-helicase domain-containing protein n=1 Tax=Mycobacterium sp. ACS4331 TaxID=1834121 RepID=UPI0007FE5DBA|nr:UvrD-helicase domain-containing protein [Mycobacterium sp. ACS4331]OBF25401.1 exodeoxyribonuclease V subunit beta [Mycobacterium sp. ACS4331]